MTVDEIVNTTIDCVFCFYEAVYTHLLLKGKLSRVAFRHYNTNILEQFLPVQIKLKWANISVLQSQQRL